VVKNILLGILISLAAGRNPPTLAAYDRAGLRSEAADQTKSELLPMMTAGMPPLPPRATEISSSSLRRSTGFDPAAGMQTPLCYCIKDTPWRGLGIDYGHACSRHGF
jgi:hypothetical protein